MRVIPRIGVWLAFALLWAPGALGAFDRQAHFVKISTAEGLPNNSISALVQDRKGFLWIGTQGGLVRWDGYEYLLFENEPFKENVLPHNQIQTLWLDDAAEALWIGTYGGVSRLDLKTHQFTSWKQDPEDPGSLGHDVVTAIARDTQGRLWVGTLNGLYRQESSGSFRAFKPADGPAGTPETPGALAGAVVRSLHRDEQGRFWVGTSTGGLALYVPEAEAFRIWRPETSRPSSLPSAAVMDIDVDRQGRFWFACWDGGLAYSDNPETGRFETVRTEDLRLYAVNAQDPLLIRAASWGGGLFEYEPIVRRVTRHVNSPRAGSLSNDVAYSLLLDANGDFWVGTNGGGLNRLNRDEGYYETLQSDSQRPETLAPGKVTTLLRDRRGLLWAGVYNGGLNRYDPAFDRFTRFKHDGARPGSLPNDIVNALFEDPATGLWVGTNQGLALFRPATQDFLVLSGNPDQLPSPEGLPDTIFYSIARAPEGRLWLGTYTQGLVLFDPVRRQAVRHFPPDPQGTQGPADGLIYSLAVDGRGRLWMGTNKGLSSFDGQSFTHYRYGAQNPGGLSSDTVRSLYTDSLGRLWIATTGGGLLSRDPEEERFRLFTRAQGLPSNNVRSVVEDARGGLWVGTSAGLAVLPLGQTRFRGLTVFNSLQDRDFHTGALRDANGDLNFGGANVIYRFNPASLPQSLRPPRLRLSSVTRAGQSLGEVQAPYLERLHLNWYENQFAVSFSVLDYRDPSKNRYRFYLEGFEDTWRPEGRTHRAEYTNLPGGRYTLRIQGANPDGLWDEDYFALPIEVDSPPWAQPWAYVFYLVGLVGLGWIGAALVSRAELHRQVVELRRLKSDLEGANIRLSELTRLDGLTEIPNRRRFDEALSQAYAQAVRDQSTLSLLMIDLDYFKAYNDHFGHLKGDEALRTVAQTLRDHIERVTDLVARFGGEEFAVLLPTTEAEGAVGVAERLRQAVENLRIPHPVSLVGPFLTISVGIASLKPERGTLSQSLVRLADQRLYLAKDRGRNRCVGEIPPSLGS